MQKDDVIYRQAAIEIIDGYMNRLVNHIGAPTDNERYAYARGTLLGVERGINALPSAQPETHDKCTETHDVSFEKQRIVTSPLNELWKKWAKEKDDYSLREYKLKLAYSAGFEDGLRAKREGKENEQND